LGKARKKGKRNFILGDLRRMPHFLPRTRKAPDFGDNKKKGRGKEKKVVLTAVQKAVKKSHLYCFRGGKG